MSRLFAIATSDGFVASYHGRALVHDNREEMEFLFHRHRIVEVTGTKMPIMWVKHHPQCASIEFPLQRETFETGPRSNPLREE